ncbi:MAG: CvpA family protein [Oscillospiraceae bacterium]|nr:CvpA family protein [Oscillospiraceae bacterium]
MYILFDLLMLALIALFVWKGYRNGILRGAVTLGLFALSVFAAGRLTAIVTPMLADSLPMPGVGTKFASYVATNLIEDPAADLVRLFSDWGLSPRAAQGLSNFVEGHSEDFSASVAKTLSQYVDRLLTEALVFLFLFLLFVLISLFIRVMFKNALETPVLSTADKALGMGIYGLTAVAAVLMICFLVSWIMPLIDASFDLALYDRLVRRSFLLSLTEKINPFALLLG